jgi:16S rRNA C1402 (ribose-2'-O) methylase RsmI
LPAHEQGIEVAIGGPSAILLALMASGLSGQRFAFSAICPPTPMERTGIAGTRTTRKPH